MDIMLEEFSSKSRLKSLLDHLGQITDPRDVRRVAFQLREVLFLVVCGTICDCDDYEHIAGWGETHIAFLRRYLPYENGVPGGRWLTLLMNRISPGLFEAVFSAFVRDSFPGKSGHIAIDGKTSRRSHDRAEGVAPLHLLSAYATTRKLVLSQLAVAEKANEIIAIPELVRRLGENHGLHGALVSIDAIATNPACASAIIEAGADYLLAVKGNQPTLQTEIAAIFNDANLRGDSTQNLDIDTSIDKGHGRIEERRVSVTREVAWLSGERRYPGELRLPAIACLIKVHRRTELKDRCRTDTGFYISSAKLTALQAAEAIRNHWQIENGLHWVLDTVFKEDQSRLRKGHGAHNMAIVRHFAINLVRAIDDKQSIKLRRKHAGWSTDYLASILGELSR
jgi:predicted transposase YbfD/YdcC